MSLSAPLREGTEPSPTQAAVLNCNASFRPKIQELDSSQRATNAELSQRQSSLPAL